MRVSPDEALQALGDIGRAQGRVAAHDRYRRASVYIFIWALTWFLANVALGVFPANAGRWAWPVVGGAGVVASLGAAVMFGGARRTQDDERAGWDKRLRPAALALTFFGFFLASGQLLPAIGPREGSAFICLVVAFSYIALGVWMGWRLLAIGLGSAALVLGGFKFLAPEQFLLWLAFVGGASLAAGGVWLRRA